VGDKKLIAFYETGEARLFDLSVDRGEANDRSTPYPEEAAMLKSRLDGYLVAVNGYRTRQSDGELLRRIKSLYEKNGSVRWCLCGTVFG
jgi:hypothetical protein